MQQGKLFVISGPSGAGKSLICEELIKSGDFQLSISMTTRKPRGAEIHGVNYFFVSEEAFDEAIEKGELLEYAGIYAHRYGTPKAPVLNKLEAGQDVILEIEMQGAMQIKAACPDAVLIYILPPSLRVLRERLEKRGTEDAQQLERRTSEALNEIRRIREYDYCVVNDDLEQALEDVRSIAKSEHCRIGEDADEIIKRFEEEE
jgi:guanylate kinase